MVNEVKYLIPVLATIHAVSKKHGKLYCYPSQKKVQELLELYHNIKISISTLNRWLRDFEDKGYLPRVRRIWWDKKKGTIFKSTLYKISIKGYQALARVGVSVWREIKAITTQGIKNAERALSRFKGPTSLKTIFAATTMFPLGVKTFLVEK
ncbi:hypothetical protein ES703_37880 [subsurface metagenome]